jgi:hypothetical protein
MPLHYVFKDLAIEIKRILSPHNKNIAFSDVEQIIMKYANERSQVLVEVLLYCDSQLQNYLDTLKDYLSALRTSIAGMIGKKMLGTPC